jgi:hypothetical protein
MIDWLLKISGKNNSQNMEKSELLELRKEVAKLKRKVNIKIQFNSYTVSKRRRDGGPIWLRRG